MYIVGPEKNKFFLKQLGSFFSIIQVEFKKYKFKIQLIPGKGTQLEKCVIG